LKVPQIYPDKDNIHNMGGKVLCYKRRPRKTEGQSVGEREGRGRGDKKRDGMKGIE